MLVKEINRIINSITSSRSSDNMYLGITFFGGGTGNNGQVQSKE